MKRFKHLLLAAPLCLFANLALAQAEYVTIEMEVDVAASAEDTWAAVGGYCDISEWLGLSCEITSGDGGIGSVRSLLDGRIIEVMVAQTELSYGYTQPNVPGEFYNLYHGFMEARPVDANNSRLLYTLMLDVSNMPDQAAKDADVARRRATFERALNSMKELAEQ